MMEKDRYLSVFICFIGSSWQSESWVAGGSSRVFFVLFCCWVWFFVCFLCLFFMAWVGRDPKGHQATRSPLCFIQLKLRSENLKSFNTDFPGVSVRCQKTSARYSRCNHHFH